MSGAESEKNGASEGVRGERGGAGGTPQGSKQKHDRVAGDKAKELPPITYGTTEWPPTWYELENVSIEDSLPGVEYFGTNRQNGGCIPCAFKKIKCDLEDHCGQCKADNRPPTNCIPRAIKPPPGSLEERLNQRYAERVRSWVAMKRGAAGEASAEGSSVAVGGGESHQAPRWDSLVDLEGE